MNNKVIVTNWVHQEVRDYLARHCTLVANMDRDTPFTRERIMQEGANASALLAFMPDRVDDAMLANMPELRIVACALKGYDNFDVGACTRRGVWVSIVPDLLTEPTAELTVGLMIGLGRNILNGDRSIRTRGYEGWRARFYGTGLAGSTVSLIGMGAVGQAVARRLSGFGASLLYVDQRPLHAETERELKVVRTGIDDALARSDFIVLLMPLSEETSAMFGAETIARMRPGSFLINPGRGSLVDEEAVADAIASGHLAGYAADVFEMEDWARPDRPKAISRRLVDDPDRTCLTPHIGSAVESVRLEIAMAAARSIVQALRGERPEGAINNIETPRRAVSM